MPLDLFSFSDIFGLRGFWRSILSRQSRERCIMKKETLIAKGETGIIEVDLFSEEVDSLEHPEVIHFRGLLEEVAEQYRCRLIFFEVERGTVSFSFDNDVLTAEILKMLQMDSPGYTRH